jgi:hypothetical protein
LDIEVFLWILFDFVYIDVLGLEFREERELGLANEDECLALVLESGRSADAMDIGLGTFRDIVLDNPVYHGEI